MNKKLIIFDVDGTLVKPISITTKPTDPRAGWGFRITADDWEWLPGRLAKLAELHLAGVKLGIATNQGGVAYGHHDAHAMYHAIQRTAEEGHITYVDMCFTHPHAPLAQFREDSPRRKPGPGMLLAIMASAGVEARETLFVGDRAEDEAAARNAHVAFMWVEDYFKEEKNDHLEI